MGQLTNVKHELFCRGLAAGKSQSQAYADAGYEKSTTNSSVMARRPDIKERVAELLEEKEQRFNGGPNGDLDYEAAVERARGEAVIDPGWVIAELMENAKLARDAGQYAASNKALELLGKEVGLFQEGNKDKKALEDEAKQEQQKRAQTAIPLDKVNKLLDNIGFTGQVDLQTMEAVPAKPKKPPITIG
jgi:hypothetical protein